MVGRRGLRNAGASAAAAAGDLNVPVYHPLRMKVLDPHARVGQHLAKDRARDDNHLPAGRDGFRPDGDNRPAVGKVSTSQLCNEGGDAGT